MNIMEIKKYLHTNNEFHSDDLIEYVNQRLERRNSHSYKMSLFKIINGFIQRTTHLDFQDYRIFYCEAHNEIEIEENPISLNGSGWICQSAYNTNYFTCQNCDEIDLIHYRRQADDSENEYCEGCYDEITDYCDDCDYNYHSNRGCQCNERSNLNDWDTRNPLHFLGKETSTKFDGVEIEMQCYQHQSRNEVVEMFRDCFNRDQTNVICKRDGSLDPSKGFEMSTTNCSFQYHKNHFWNDFFELKPAQYCKAYDGSDCGIHIHTNRNYFSENNLRALNCFYNNPKNKNLIVDIAGREGSDYCRFIPSITFDDPIHTRGDDETGRSYKYRVINFNNKDTVEVRIFRSNLKKISFFRYLEFNHTVQEWIKETDPTRYEKITWVEYFDWLLKNLSKDFSNLLFFLSKRNHFDHLETIEEWQDVYTNYKTVITDFVNANQELIESEGE
jgi:hypothetical protein